MSDHNHAGHATDAPGGAHGAEDDYADAYSAIAEDNDESRWAFGTGFDDPLAGVDTTVPEGVDAAELAEYCLMLGDDALVMSHRLQEWVSNAPELEDEVAVANIGLDLLGQARLLLARAGRASGSDRSEDSFAYFREPAAFRNVTLVEAPNGDFAEAVVRLLVFATYRLALLARLRESRDPVLSAIAKKGVGEVNYHRDYAARWLVRLGDGTAYSHERAVAGVESHARRIAELFTGHPVEMSLAEVGIAVDPATLRTEFADVLAQVAALATLPLPTAYGPVGEVAEILGRNGIHTEALTDAVTEWQSVARALPDATW